MNKFTRRNFVGAAGFLALAPGLAPNLASAHAGDEKKPAPKAGADRALAPRATSRAKDLTEDELNAMFERCNNAGRWGADDELGTLNYITAEKRVAAAQLVKTGEVVSAGRDLSTAQSKVDPRPLQQIVMYNGGGAGISDYFSIAPHGMTITHLDALCHFSVDDKLYNNRKRSENVTAAGSKWGSVYAIRQGIFTRGVLLDVAEARGVKWYESDEYVTVADLEAAEKRQNVKVQSGDVMFVRTGMERMEKEVGLQDVYPRAGLHAECVEWMHQREVAVYGGDCIEKLPYPSDHLTSPMHMIGLVAMGMPILDWPGLVELTETCKRLDRWDFLISTAPWRVPGGTSSPLNPLCTF